MTAFGYVECMKRFQTAHNPWYFLFKKWWYKSRSTECASRDQVSCWLIERHVSLSSLNHRALNETRVRFFFCLLEKIHYSLLHNYFNGKKWPLTEHSLCFSFPGIYIDNYPRTQHMEEHSAHRLHWSLFSSSSQTIADCCRQSLSSVWWRSLTKLQGGGRKRRLSWKWTPDRLFWPSPGYQNKCTQRHINPHMG